MFGEFSLLTGCLSLSGGDALAGKHPEPSVYPLPRRGTSISATGIPKRIVVDVPGKKTPRRYWYLTYTVTNNTGKEQDFFPDFEMVTQDGKIHRAITTSPWPSSTPSKDRRKRSPDSADAIAGSLHQGEDQAKDGVAIWEEPMPRMGDVQYLCRRPKQRICDRKR